jgi:hypothetical protein
MLSQLICADNGAAPDNPFPQSDVTYRTVVSDLLVALQDKTVGMQLQWTTVDEQVVIAVRVRMGADGNKCEKGTVVALQRIFQHLVKTVQVDPVKGELPGEETAMFGSIVSQCCL